jgi:hypothetical protein
VFGCSLLKYTHSDVVLVCKLLSHCCNELEEKTKDETILSEFKNIYTKK